MLTSGMVPALFADDEKDQIIGQVLYKITNVYVCTLTYMYTILNTVKQLNLSRLNP